MDRFCSDERDELQCRSDPPLTGRVMVSGNPGHVEEASQETNQLASGFEVTEAARRAGKLVRTSSMESLEETSF